MSDADAITDALGAAINCALLAHSLMVLENAMADGTRRSKWISTLNNWPEVYATTLATLNRIIAEIEHKVHVATSTESTKP